MRLLAGGVWGCREPLSRYALPFIGILGLLSVNAAQAAVGAKGFCASHMVRDYEKPFERMRPIHRLPVSGVLPFAPRRLEILRVGFSSLVVGGGPMGFYISTGDDDPPLRLNWIVNTRLSRVDREGAIQRVLRTRQQHFGTERFVHSRNLKLWFKVRKLGLYRLDLSFARKSGEKLASFAEYFRIVSRRLNVRLGVDASFYRPGDVALFRLENFGTTVPFYGYQSVFERYTGSTWEMDPSSPTEWILVGLGLPAGTAGKCQGFRIPPDLALGRYRISKDFNPRLGSRVVLRRSAEFNVVPQGQ